MTINFDTSLIDLHRNDVAGISKLLSGKLAEAVASHVEKADYREVTVADLLTYYPSRYEDRSKFLAIQDIEDGKDAAVELYTRISGGFRVGKNRPRGSPPLFIFEITASDKDRTIKPVVVWWFVSGKNAIKIINYWKERFRSGTRFIAYGTWEWDGRRNAYALKLKKPDELEILAEPEDDASEMSESEAEESDETAGSGSGEDERFEAVHVARNVPVYRKLGSFQPKRMREIMFDVIRLLDPASVDESLPVSLLKKYNLHSRAKALAEIHFPPEESALVDYEAARSEAHRRLIFEEFFRLLFALRYRRGNIERIKKGPEFRIDGTLREKLKKMLPFKLTDAQKRVVGQILEDMSSNTTMNRLIQGDVGSGKTIVAFMAAFAALSNGYQAVMMAPTEILAEQHYKNAKRFFNKTGIEVELLIGGLKAKEKRDVHEKISSGSAQFIVGTHALIQEAVEFKKLGLAIIDEQHRFGVAQRAELRERAEHPDILVMTATPIPRSLAMTVYGDLEVSIIDEMPPGRTPVKTVVVGEDKRKGVYKGIEREVNAGRQVYIVYPLVEESESLDLKAATDMYDELANKAFPEYRIGLVHGRLKPEEKEDVMRRFKAGEIDILVSTTVIEVGVDVPNASLMIVEHAERFGLSQLHQLRGRVGRGSDQSFCVLLTGLKKTVTAKERLGIMEESSDGFVIAEKDLEIRGQGDIAGTRQSGLQTFRLANILRDLSILTIAKQEADKYLTDNRYKNDRELLVENLKNDPRMRFYGVG